MIIVPAIVTRAVHHSEPHYRHLAIVNCCNITNKREDLELFLSSNHIEIILGTESKLDRAISNAEIFPKNYCCYRKDRNTFGGGVFILVKDLIPSNQVSVDSPCEIVWAQLHTTGSNSNIIVGSFTVLLTLLLLSGKI